MIYLFEFFRIYMLGFLKFICYDFFLVSINNPLCYYFLYI